MRLVRRWWLRAYRDQLRDRFRRLWALELADDAAVPEGPDRRDRVDAEPLGQFGSSVDVNLDERDAAFVRDYLLFEYGGEHAAGWAAPWRPEVEHDRRQRDRSIT